MPYRKKIRILVIQDPFLTIQPAIGPAADQYVEHIVLRLFAFERDFNSTRYF